MITSMRLANAVKISKEEQYFFNSEKFDIEKVDAVVIKITDKRTGSSTHTTLFNVIYWQEQEAEVKPIRGPGRPKKDSGDAA